MQPEKTKKADKPTAKKTTTKKAAASTPSISTDETLSQPPVSAPKKAATKTQKAVTPKSVEPKIQTTPKTARSKTPTSGKTPVSLTFQIGYGTAFGQVIKICGDHPALGGGSDDKAVALRFEDSNHWSGQIHLATDTGLQAGFSYYYLVEHPDGSVDKSTAYHLRVPAGAKAVYIRDAWNSPAFIENAFSSDVFDVLQKRTVKAASAKNPSSKSKSKTASHEFRVKAPALAQGQAICLTGSHEKLGRWDAQNALLLTLDPVSKDWVTGIELPDLQEPIAYKYGIYDLDQKAFLRFEDGENRILIPLPARNKDSRVQLHDGFVRTN